MPIQLSDHFTHRRLLRFTLPFIGMMILSIVGFMFGTGGSALGAERELLVAALHWGGWSARRAISVSCASKLHSTVTSLIISSLLFENLYQPP